MMMSNCLKKKLKMVKEQMRRRKAMEKPAAEEICQAATGTY